MSDYNWSEFIVRIPIDASKQELYDAWATRRGIEYWFLRMSEYKSADGKLKNDNEQVQQGDTYAWRWYGWPDEVEEHGHIISCNGKDQFKFSFGDAGICAVTIKEEGKYTIVELHQTEIPSDEHGKQYWHIGCRMGWTFYLANMKSLFEGGIDLRNKDESLKNVLNA